MYYIRFLGGMEMKAEKICDHCGEKIEIWQEEIYLLADGAIVHYDCLRDYLAEYAKEELLPVKIEYEEVV